MVLGNAQVCSRLAAATSVPAAALLLLLQWLRESSTVKSAGSLLLLVSLVGHSALQHRCPTSVLTAAPVVAPVCRLLQAPSVPAVSLVTR